MHTGQVLHTEQKGLCIIKFVGEIRFNLCSALDILVRQLFEQRPCEGVLVDLREADFLDSTALGLLAKITIASKKYNKPVPTLISPQPDINRVLQSLGFEKVFRVIETTDITPEALSDLYPIDEDPQQMGKRVLEAHQALME